MGGPGLKFILTNEKIRTTEKISNCLEIALTILTRTALLGTPVTSIIQMRKLI